MKTFKELKEEIARINNIDVEGFDSDWVLRKFARDQALINIELIKPYTNKYNLIVMYLVTGKDASDAYDAATDAATDAYDAATDADYDDAYAAAYVAYAAAAADYDSAYAAAYAADIATVVADYAKAIESLNTLANEYLTLLL